MLARITDLLVLRPSRFEIAAAHKTRLPLPSTVGDVEVWTQRTQPREPDAFLLKFPGTGGRAERLTEHPAECWPDLGFEVWAVNPPGYGGSAGRASLQRLGAAARAVYTELERRAEGRPIMLTGNSLGGLSALHLAARFSPAGLLLRNPPPLRELIAGRFGWWTLHVGSLLARQTPAELCTIANARQARAPALFVLSGRDRVAPPRFQSLIHQAYRGDMRLMRLGQADHATPLEPHEEPEYLELLRWLREAAFSSATPSSSGTPTSAAAPSNSASPFSLEHKPARERKFP